VPQYSYSTGPSWIEQNNASWAECQAEMARNEMNRNLARIQENQQVMIAQQQQQIWANQAYQQRLYWNSLSSAQRRAELRRQRRAWYNYYTKAARAWQASKNRKLHKAHD
jgi:hypothetical protein